MFLTTLRTIEIEIEIEIDIENSVLMTFNLTGYLSSSKFRDSKITSFLIVKALIFSFNSQLIVVRVLTLERYRSRNSRRRIIIVLSI